MAEQPKRLILAKGHCGTCQSPVSVEVEEPAPLVKVEMAPCKCGKTENERVVRWVVLAVMSIVIAFMGSCITNQYFTTQQIKAIAEKYQVRKASLNDHQFFNESDFIVEPKPETPPASPKK